MSSINDVIAAISHFIFVKDLEPLVYISTIIAAIILCYGLYRAIKIWKMGQPIPWFDDLGRRIYYLFKYSIWQVKVRANPLPGLIHTLIFWGTTILLIGTVLRAVEFDITLKTISSRFLVGGVYLGCKLALNIGGMVLILGLILAYYRRIRGLTPNLPFGPRDHYMLISLLLIALTGFFLDSVNTLAYRMGWIGFFDPIGWSLALLYESQGLTYTSLITVYRAVWIFHMLLAVFSIGFLPFTKFFHIVAAGFFNIFYSRLEHPSAFKPISKIDEKVEKGEVLGAVKMSDLSWKQRMDFDACTECARCQNVCPAVASGKPLSPMLLIQSLKKLMYERGGDAPLASEDTVDPNIYWSCVTCGACVYECPAMIHHVETILDVRRGLVSAEGYVPEGLMQASYNIMRLGNPFGFNPDDKASWMQELSKRTGVPFAQPGEEYDYLYWIGCNTGFDPNIRPVAEALLTLLKRAGIKVALLAEETCCGEPARRIGDEFLFEETVKTVGDILSHYKFKSLLVNCPHGYNNFKHEYPLYGVKIDVVHHTQLLHQLLLEGKVKPREAKDLIVTYHDPCYLARWNDVLDEPRSLIKSTGAELIEMKNNGKRTFCCGGGGGHFFFDIKIGERISKLRAQQAAETGAKTIVVACPFCNAMLRSEAEAMGLKVVDVAQLLAGRSTGEDDV